MRLPVFQTAVTSAARITGRLAGLLSALLLAQAGDWPQWRGPDRSGHPSVGTPAPTSLAAAPHLLWRIKIGPGFSSPVVSGGKLLFTDAQGPNETAHLLDAKTGKELWSAPYDTAIEDEWGTGPRATPFIDGDRCYLQSCRGEFECRQLRDGHKLWSVNFEKDFGVTFGGSKAKDGTATRRGHNGSAIIDGKNVIVPVGSADGATLVCFDKASGKQIWKTGTDETAYSSLCLATLTGVRQVVALTADALLGADPRTGKILWRFPLRTDAKRHAATPVIRGDMVVVNSHTFGAECFRITRQGDVLRAEKAWINSALKINVATPVLVDSFLYGQGPSKNFVCFDAGTGVVQWQQPGFGREYSAVISASSKLLVLTDNGELLLIRADPTHYDEISRVQICGKNWSHPAYVDGRLFVRDLRELLCVDLIN